MGDRQLRQETAVPVVFLFSVAPTRGMPALSPLLTPDRRRSIPFLAHLPHRPPLHAGLSTYSHYVKTLNFSTRSPGFVDAIPFSISPSFLAGQMGRIAAGLGSSLINIRRWHIAESEMDVLCKVLADHES